MENLQLKEIAKSIETISEKIEKVDNQTKGNNSQNLHDSFKNLYDFLININERYEQKSKSHLLAQQQLKIYFEGFKNGFPLETKQHLIVGTILKFHIYLYTFFICILITFSIYTLDSFKDKTNYQNAWEELISLNNNEESSKMLHSILERNSD